MTNATKLVTRAASARNKLMIADEPAKKLILGHVRIAELFASVINIGVRNLKMEGMEKLLKGLTDLKIVCSVCIK